jgi:DNA (cytosine-5)-methyltransferase 1
MTAKGFKDLKVVDLFSGGGGMSLGFTQAGFNVVASFDNWDVAIKHCELNLKHVAEKCDLSHVQTAIKQISKYSPSVIIGGPPCQDFSSAGKRDESGGRANLTVCFAKIIEKLEPAYFVMENVDRALSSKALADALKIFLKSGYGITVQILNASLCGVPQLRKRLFVIGVKNSNENALQPYLLKNLASKPMTLREYFGNKLEIDHYYRHPRSYKRRGVFSIDEPSPTIRGVNRPVPDGYPGHKGDTIQIGANIRPLSSRERAMVQTFPEDYKLEGAKTEIEQLIGNAVPVQLGFYVAKALKNYIVRH